MKRFIYFTIPFLAMVLASCFVARLLTAEAAASQKGGKPRSVCVTKCLRTYEKCQSRAGSSVQITACYQQFLECQQSCR
jgi:hypothetical protein